MNVARAMILAAFASAAWSASPATGAPPGDWSSIAERHAVQAADALARSDRTMRAWLSRRDPQTGLLPRNGKNPNWVVQDSAADLYPFMVLASYFLDRKLYEGAMWDILRDERRLTTRVGRLSDDFAAGGKGFVAPEIDLDRIIFGSSEYVKDGLVPITELLGESPWYYRMRGIATDLVRRAPYRLGPHRLPARSAEINGNMLQLLSRLYWRTGDPEYLDQIVAIADFYLLHMLPKTGYIPAHLWDFEAGRPANSTFTFSDHGNEIVSGLGEAWLLTAHKLPEKAKQYREPFLRMIDRLLEVGRNRDGVWITSVDLDGKALDSRPAHCWGYLFKPVYVAHLISGERKYKEAVEIAIRGVIEHPRYLFDDTGAGRNWAANAYSDAIESALVLLNRLPDPTFERGIDIATRKMLERQREDGIIEDWHGDGNYIRTALMYAFWKTQGTWLEPWSGQVRLGAVRDGQRLMLVAAAETGWNGRIRFDTPRHRYVWNMAINYPRLNEYPEWYVVEPDGLYEVEVDGERVLRSGSDLVRGIPLSLQKGSPRRIVVAPLKE